MNDWLELRHLRYVLAVAEELHFSRAAERLHMAQPPLSQQIGRIEQRLGVRLFERTKRKVTLTPAGQAFVASARVSLDQAEQAAVAAQRAERGEIGQIQVGFVASATYTILPEILRAFRRRYPDVTIRLHELVTAAQVEALLDRQLDVGFLRPPVPNSLLVEPVLRERLLVALPEAHPLAVQPAIELAQLAGDPFIVFPRQHGIGLYDRILSLCRQAGFTPDIVQEAREVHTISALVAAGLGVALLPAAAERMFHSGLVYRRLAGVDSAIEMSLGWRQGERSPVVARFRDIASNVSTYRDMEMGT